MKIRKHEEDWHRRVSKKINNATGGYSVHQGTFCGRAYMRAGQGSRAWDRAVQVLDWVYGVNHCRGCFQRDRLEYLERAQARTRGITS